MDYATHSGEFDMIACISGKLISKTPTQAVIESGGIGFLLFISLSSYEKIGEPGSEVTIQTHLHAREDALQLYGFVTLEERSLFQHLISVSGIGPKLALGILSGIEVTEFRQAVASNDIERLTHAPGVGRKTAERLVLELREKLGPEDTEAAKGLGSGASETVESSVQALVSLGFKKPRAREVVGQILKTNPGLSIEETIRLALRKL